MLLKWYELAIMVTLRTKVGTVIEHGNLKPLLYIRFAKF